MPRHAPDPTSGKGRVAAGAKFVPAGPPVNVDRHPASESPGPHLGRFVQSLPASRSDQTKTATTDAVISKKASLHAPNQP